MIRHPRIFIVCAVVFCSQLSAARAAPATFFATLSGSAEQPPNASPGVGFAQIDYDSALHTLQLQISFSGLVTTGTGTTASHIHAPTAVPLAGTAGVATTTPTFAGFPLGVRAGTYSNLLDLTLASSWNPTYITNNGGTTAGAEAAFAAALFDGKSYLNVHSNTIPGGEIRGFLVLAVPEPASAVVWCVGGLALAAGCRRRSLRA